MNTRSIGDAWKTKGCTQVDKLLFIQILQKISTWHSKSSLPCSCGQKYKGHFHCPNEALGQLLLHRWNFIDLAFIWCPCSLLQFCHSIQYWLWCSIWPYYSFSRGPSSLSSWCTFVRDLYTTECYSANEIQCSDTPGSLRIHSPIKMIGFWNSAGVRSVIMSLANNSLCTPWDNKKDVTRY